MTPEDVELLERQESGVIVSRPPPWKWIALVVLAVLAVLIVLFATDLILSDNDDSGIVIVSQVVINGEDDAGANKTRASLQGVSVGSASREQLLSLQYYVLGVMLCTNLTVQGSGWSNCEGEWSVMGNLPESEDSQEEGDPSLSPSMTGVPSPSGTGAESPSSTGPSDESGGESLSPSVMQTATGEDPPPSVVPTGQAKESGASTATGPSEPSAPLLPKEVTEAVKAPLLEQIQAPVAVKAPLLEQIQAPVAVKAPLLELIQAPEAVKAPSSTGMAMQSQEDYDNYGIAEAIADTTNYVDLMNPASVARLSKALPVQTSRLNKNYTFGVVRWMKPIKVRATIPLSNGQTFYTKANGTVADDGYGFTNVQFNGTFATPPAELAVSQLNNGGAYFRFLHPLNITEDAARTIRIVLAFNPHGIVKAINYTSRQSAFTDSNGAAISIPFLSLTPIVLDHPDKSACRESYHIAFHSAFVRLDIYYVCEDADKALKAASSTLVYSDETTEDMPDAPVINFVESRAEGEELVYDFLTWDHIPFVEGLARAASGVVVINPWVQEMVSGVPDASFERVYQGPI